MNTKELEKILEGESNKSAAGQIWTVTKCLTAFSWATGKFIIKNTPTVLGAAWDIKKEISEEIATSIQEVRKEQKQLELEDKIKMLSNKKEIK